jgi:carbonic anhydrase
MSPRRLSSRRHGKKQRAALHGWVYDMQSGLIKPLLELAPGDALDDDIYRYDDPVSD